MQEQIAVDPDFESALEVPLEEPSTSSLRSSLLQFQQENGRTYHRLSEGNLQDNLYLITLDGKGALNPGAESAKRVLDMGTGTGLWALEFADQHPEAQVVGVDLSPIQPAFLPSNCTFEIDDLEKEWTWKVPFDFVFCRMMTGSFADPEAMAKKVFNGLSAEGWYEIQDIQLPVFCDDGTLDPKTSPIMKWQEAILERTGFHNVDETIFRWPTNSWPKDRKLKELGKWNLANFDAGLEGVSLALFTRVLSWSKEDVLALCADVRRELRNPKVHGYWKIYVVYGQKPKGGIPE
ncbi:hypothetical protein CDV36_001850 [Fusarium kuroshium]|uniref:Methyltransferase domain-containing protein n=1 Tax=Fusarium kuroshium TaxID=2010991 RepID=A0A3M2SLM2_9HYPO|nr:hypothetical protein CDV36_001850 [Fusarium kuroshium]